VNGNGDKTKNRRPLLVGGLILSLVVVWVVWWQWDAVRGVFSGDAAPDAGSGAEISSAEPKDAGESEHAAPPLSEIARAERRWAELLGQPPVWPEDLAAPKRCEEVEAALVRVCTVLDQRDYVRAGAPAGGSCGLIRALAEELAAHPPDISSELKSYETILDNVFHLFRVLGRKRMELVRRVQWEEHELAEPASLAIFRWLISREGCARSGSTTLTTEGLYEYAGFFFNTMGGQAYLRRRAPRIEALASFYALMILDRAQQDGHNPAGIDPRPEIQRARALLETEPLVFREHYLVVLDQMAERWKERSEPS